MSKKMKPADVRVGVIGYGGAFNMGKGHLTELAAAGATPAAVCDLDKLRLAVAAQDFPGIATFTSPAEMLKKSDVNLVVIITPHNTHADLAVQCLKAGRHVVVEKPFAITTAECDAMIAAARKNGVLLSTYHNRHWDGCILEAVDRIVTQGAIGEVVRIEAHMGSWGKPGDWWRTSKTISGGILYDWGVHLLEYTLQLARSEIAEVSGFAKCGFWAAKTPWGKDTNEDEGFLVVRYAGGAWSTLRISSIDSAPPPGWVDVTGTTGAYRFDYKTYTLVTHKGSATVTETGNNRDSEHSKFYRNIVDHLCGGAKLVITPEWARRPVHIIDLACKSAEKGKTLAAKYR